jgi:hypothetical protein
VDIGKSLQFSFDDERWISKLGLGALISAIPILNIAWVGYTVEIMRRAIAREGQPLPEWDELGQRWMDGLYMLIAGLIYAIPGVVLLCMPIGIMIVPAFLENQDIQGPLAIFTTTAGFALFCCVGIYFLAFSFFFPAVQIRYSQENSLSSCFQLRQILQLIRGNLSEYLVAWLFAILASFIIGLIVSILSAAIGWIPCLGQLFVWVVAMVAGAYTGVVTAHLFGQFGSKAIHGFSTSIEDQGQLQNG